MNSYDADILLSLKDIIQKSISCFISNSSHYCSIVMKPNGTTKYEVFEPIQYLFIIFKDY